MVSERDKNGWYKQPQGVTTEFRDSNVYRFICPNCEKTAQAKAPRSYVMAEVSGMKFKPAVQCVCGWEMHMFPSDDKWRSDE